MHNEKRNYSRYNVFFDPPSCSKSDSEDSKIDIRDISCSGIKICTDERLIKGDMIDLEIVIPSDDIPLFILGEVVWVVKDPGFDKTYNAGVRLKKVNDFDHKRLVGYIHSNFTPSTPSKLTEQ